MSDYAFQPGPKGQDRIWRETSPGVGRWVRQYRTGKYGPSIQDQMKKTGVYKKMGAKGTGVIKKLDDEGKIRGKIPYAGYDPSEED